MAGSKKPREIRTTGTVTEIGWDDAVGAPQVAIDCHSGEELPVQMNSVGLDLADLVDEEVSIQGTVVYDDLGNAWLEVHRFAVVYQHWDDDQEPWVEPTDDDLDWDRDPILRHTGGGWH